jgi:hypothetical protein
LEVSQRLSSKRLPVPAPSSLMSKGWLPVAWLSVMRLSDAGEPPKSIVDTSTMPPAASGEGPVPTLSSTRLSSTMVWVAPARTMPAPEVGGASSLGGQALLLCTTLLSSRSQWLASPGAPVFSTMIPKQLSCA